MTKRTPNQIKQDREDSDRDMRKLAAHLKGKKTKHHKGNGIITGQQRWTKTAPFVMPNWG
tara:strand:- start:462 stop:641 length:180 start_codon:yes stop_codon:yes gene_type:complete